jgi:hypothetical protein
LSTAILSELLPFSLSLTQRFVFPILPICLLALTAAELISAAPQATSTTTTTSSSPTPSSTDNSTTPSCGFAGDDNTYGLGIRIGVYLQWICSSIAYNFVPEEAVTMRGVNTCFTISNFAGKTSQKKNHFHT